MRRLCVRRRCISRSASAVGLNNKAFLGKYFQVLSFCYFLVKQKVGPDFITTISRKPHTNKEKMCAAEQSLRLGVPPQKKQRGRALTTRFFICLAGQIKRAQTDRSVPHAEELASTLPNHFFQSLKPWKSYQTCFGFNTQLLNKEKSMYERITSGTPMNCSMINNTKLHTKNTKRISLPFQLKCLNLSAMSGSSATSKKDKTRQREHKISGEEKATIAIAPLCEAAIKHNEEIKIPFAGVGKPMNESD